MRRGTFLKTTTMDVKLDKRYPLDVDAERAWAVLSDVLKVAGCMPGTTRDQPPEVRRP